MKWSADFVAKQKDLLLKEKARLEKSIKKLKEYPDYDAIDEDQALELTDYETNLSVDQQLEKLLLKVDSALRSIEKGTYGQCKVCKKAIEEGRLEAMPYAEICVTCGGRK
jgi:RNA polymerase-binding protein DksA